MTFLVIFLGVVSVALAHSLPDFVNKFSPDLIPFFHFRSTNCLANFFILKNKVSSMLIMIFRVLFKQKISPEAKATGHKRKTDYSTGKQK